MERHGSFHGIHSWKLQLMEEMEASTSTDSGSFHVLACKNPLTSMEVNLPPPTTSTDFHGSFLFFHGSKLIDFHASRFTSIEVCIEVGGISTCK